MGRKKRRKKRSNFIVPFCITLVIVVLAGLFGLLAYQYIETAEEPVRQDYQSTKQTVSEDVAAEKRKKR